MFLKKTFRFTGILYKKKKKIICELICIYYIYLKEFHGDNNLLMVSIWFPMIQLMPNTGSLGFL